MKASSIYRAMFPRHDPVWQPLTGAAQFSPFAALTGHGAAIKETARETDQRIELDEHMKDLLLWLMGQGFLVMK